jgi:hypothetical protein
MVYTTVRSVLKRASVGSAFTSDNTPPPARQDRSNHILIMGPPCVVYGKRTKKLSRMAQQHYSRPLSVLIQKLVAGWTASAAESRPEIGRRITSAGPQHWCIFNSKPWAKPLNSIQSWRPYCVRNTAMKTRPTSTDPAACFAFMFISGLYTTRYADVDATYGHRTHTVVRKSDAWPRIYRQNHVAYGHDDVLACGDSKACRRDVQHTPTQTTVSAWQCKDVQMMWCT